MTRISKVYTRGGDAGTTALSDGSRVRKDDLRLDTYGTCDELNTLVGMVRERLGRAELLDAADRQQLDGWLEAIQNDLFNLGGDLATPIDKRWPQQVVLGGDDVAALERLIDHCQQSLQPLAEFVLPGGSALNAELHLCRTVCRRAERLAVRLAGEATINAEVLRYLNRLSDVFFVLARWVVARAGQTEVLWNRQRGARTLRFDG